MGGELLEGDPALAERRGGDEVEAATAGLAGERRRQREDRPERRPEGEHGTVLPAHVAAQRAELSGFPNRLTIAAGMLPISLSTSRRDAGVGNTW